MENEKELLPCPFCGNKPSDFEWKGRNRVQCDTNYECAIYGLQMDSVAWNVRNQSSGLKPLNTEHINKHVNLQANDEVKGSEKKHKCYACNDDAVACHGGEWTCVNHMKFSVNKPSTFSRDEIIKEFRKLSIDGNPALLFTENVADFIINRDKWICDPLVKYKEFKLKNNEYWTKGLRINDAIDETIARANLEGNK